MDMTTQVGARVRSLNVKSINLAKESLTLYVLVSESTGRQIISIGKMKEEHTKAGPRGLMSRCLCIHQE